jgi:hypothetical protein
LLLLTKSSGSVCCVVAICTDLTPFPDSWVEGRMDKNGPTGRGYEKKFLLFTSLLFKHHKSL